MVEDCQKLLGELLTVRDARLLMAGNPTEHEHTWGLPRDSTRRVRMESEAEGLTLACVMLSNLISRHSK